MEQRHTNNGGNGFLLGVLIGVLLTLLLTTKKGRKILKAITDQGIDKMSDLEDLFEKKVRQEESDDMGISPDRAPSPSPVIIATHQHPAMDEMTSPEEFISHEAVPSPFSKPISTGRRFFRGTPKRQTN